MIKRGHFWDACLRSDQGGQGAEQASGGAGEGFGAEAGDAASGGGAARQTIFDAAKMPPASGGDAAAKGAATKGETGGAQVGASADAEGGAEGSDAAENGEASEKSGEGWQWPSFLPEHLRDDDPQKTIENLANHAKGLRDKVAKASGQPKPPADASKYTVDLVEGLKDKVDLDSEQDRPVVDLLRQSAHQAGLSNTQFNAFFNSVLGGMNEAGMVGAPSPEKFQEEVATLGGGDYQQGAQILSTLEAYKGQLVDKGVLNSELAEEFDIMAGTANGVRVLMAMRAQSREAGIPTQSIPVESQTLAEIKGEMASDKYMNDMSPEGDAYRKDVRARYMAASAAQKK